MDTTKKKIKKGFAVPAAKPNTEDSKEADKPKKTLGINRNNNKVEGKKVKDSASETKVDKQKKEETRSSTVETNTLKPKTVEAITKAQQSEKKKEKPKKKDTEEVKKVQRSLSADEYDEIFMNVLASVMKAEREGDVEEEEEHAPAANGHKGLEEEATQEPDAGESEEDARSEVIQVTVKVESVEGCDHFAQVDAEQDIDNWDGEEKIHEAASAEVISPIRKENVKTLTTQKDKNSSILTNKKQEKKKEPMKVKEKQAAKSEVYPKKKKFVSPNEDKDKKVKKRKESKVDSGSAKQAVKSKDKISLKKVMQERELEDLGTWVQCGNPSCLKWRYLRNITDPMDIPQRWECSMNDDEQFNSCEKEEEDYDEDEHIYTKYTEGSIVLAKMAGYPWWPGMIEIDPDYDSYFEVAVPASMYPTKYHVVFFDKNVSRAWISLSGIKPFSEIEALPRKAKGHDYSKEVNAAVKNAKDAMELPIKERLKKFSFASRFSGKWGRVGDQMTAKPKKQKKRGPKRQKFDDDVMVDDKTLDQILNNSQSVLSDVAEMLSSIDTATFDSDTDPEFDVEAPKQTKRKTPTSKSEKEQATLNAMVYQEDEVEDQEAPVKFEPGQLDRDVFTMEMDTGPMETSDLEQTVNNLNLSQVMDETAEDGERMNVQDEEDVRNKNEDEESRKKKEDKEDKTFDESSKPKKKSMKTKTCVDKSLGKGDEVEKKKKNKTDRPANESEDKNCTIEKKKKRKKKKTDENDSNVSVEKEDGTENSNINDKVEKKKKKIKKCDKDLSKKSTDSTENLNEMDNAVDKETSKKNQDDEKDVSEKKYIEKKEGIEQNNAEKKKKKSKKNCDGEIDVSEKKKKRKKNADDPTEKKEVESNDVRKGKKMKMVSKDKTNDDEKENAIESRETFEKKDNGNSTESTKKETESKSVKAKKPKTKFSNPVVKTATIDDKCSQGDKSSQKEHPKGKAKAEEIAKKPDSQLKAKAHIENNESDEELNFDIPTIPVDGAEFSEDDFILDLMEPTQSKVQSAAPAAANDGEDSEPLDFEE